MEKGVGTHLKTKFLSRPYSQFMLASWTWEEVLVVSDTESDS